MSRVNKKREIADGDTLHFYSSLIAGVGSGALSTVLCAPLDLVRTQLQVWGDLHQGRRGTISIIPALLKETIQREGWKGCFRGLGASLITVPAFWGVYCKYSSYFRRYSDTRIEVPLYDRLKRQWTRDYVGVQSSIIHLLAAVSAGAVSDLIVNPAFVVRTRLQTQALHGDSGPMPRVSIKDTVLQLYGEGGIRIFWRGMSANLWGLSHVAVQFPAYEQLKRQLRNGEERRNTPGEVLLASALSKMTASLLTYPHEVVRSRMMDSRTGNAGLWKTCQRIATQEGFYGFYAGLPISLIRVIPNTCITFISYETMSQWIKEILRARD